jgi:hypothetical protein
VMVHLLELHLWRAHTHLVVRHATGLSGGRSCFHLPPCAGRPPPPQPRPSADRRNVRPLHATDPHRDCPA